MLYGNASIARLSYSRVKSHLLRITGGGIKICPRVTKSVLGQLKNVAKAPEGAKLELNRGGCPVHGSATSSLIYEVKIWWLALSFRFGMGARAPPGDNVASPLLQMTLINQSLKMCHCQYERPLLVSSWRSNREEVQHLIKLLTWRLASRNQLDAMIARLFYSGGLQPCTD